MTDFFHHLIWYHDKFLGVDWSVWKAVGWLGNTVFFTRFMVQWYATEKRRQVVIPVMFWWFSLLGSLLLLTYSIHKRDSVFICAYAVAWIPYLRNLMIHQRHENARRPCPECRLSAPASQNYCGQCGARLNPSGELEIKH
jgi:lipid-A-disaccharide synthase-like uncharacterized protein